MKTKTKHIQPVNPDKTDIWEVIQNPDPPNILKDHRMSFAIRHTDGGIIRFHQGRTMNKQEAETLKIPLPLKGV